MNLTTNKNTQHTPAPWSVIKGSPQAGIITAPNRSLGIAEVFGGGETDIANAQLIAAAPNLLVALEQCVPLIIAHANYSGEGVSTLQVARLAIAKAKGETK